MAVWLICTNTQAAIYDEHPLPNTRALKYRYKQAQPGTIRTRAAACTASQVAHPTPLAEGHEGSGHG